MLRRSHALDGGSRRAADSGGAWPHRAAKGMAVVCAHMFGAVVSGDTCHTDSP
jgi:hypothetical protein